MRTIWSIAIAIVTFTILVPLELIRIATRRSTLQSLRERLGFTEPLPRSPRRLLLHAVSAGEMNAASAVVHEMAARGWAFVLSAGNDDACRIAERIAAHHPEVERIVRLPWDRHAAHIRFLRSLHPTVVAVIETEIWPNLFFACRDLAVPLVIASGRIEPRAARRYIWFKPFFRTVFESCDRIIVIDRHEEERYRAAGADPHRILIGGSLKADACAAVHMQQPMSGKREEIVAISTHPGEEELIVAALHRVRIAHPETRLTIAPRHVRRTRTLGRFASEHTAIDGRMGAVAELCRRARIVILGGTFVPVGGHDPLEPARSGAAIVAGPSTEHIEPLMQEMLDAGALIRTNAASLADVLTALLRDDARLSRMSEAARQFAASKQGAARLHADAIERLVTAPAVLTQ